MDEYNSHHGTEALNLHILMAEDNPLNQKVAARLLQKLGCTFDIAHNGREAVSILAGSVQYDVILMDVAMPEMDGIEATRIIRASKSHSHSIPIIAHTAMHDEREACMQAGMNEFLGKPVTLSKLAEVLQRCKQQLH